MALKTDLPVILSGSAAARRLDITYYRLAQAVEANALSPIGLLDGRPVFAETEIISAASDLVRLGKVRGSAARP
jgi:hypothetical protein